MRIENPVIDEVLEEIEEVGKLKVGSDEHGKAIDGTTKLMDRAIEMEKIKLEKRKIEVEERKLDVEEQRLESDKKDRVRKDAIAVATSVGSAVVGLWVVMETFRFDRESTPTSTLGRAILNKFVPKLFK